MTNFPRGRGRILQIQGRVVIAAHCPLCAQEHRYDKGLAGDGELERIRRQGFSEEWLPCQRDLPGNFWRVMLGSNGHRPSPRVVDRAQEHE